jgi:hypothetical protein
MRLAGQRVLVTGSTSGIGKHAAILCAREGASVAVHGRDTQRGKEHLSSGDVAVAHARRVLLDALRAAEAGKLPPGSALAPSIVRIPNAREAVVEAATRWEDLRSISRRADRPGAKAFEHFVPGEPVGERRSRGRRGTGRWKLEQLSPPPRARHSARASRSRAIVARRPRTFPGYRPPSRKHTWHSANRPRRWPRRARASSWSAPAAAATTKPRHSSRWPRPC